MPSLVRAYEIDLSVAGSRVIPEAGNRIHCAVVSNASARVNVRARQDNFQANNGPFPLMLGDYVEFPDPFNQVTIEWAAQTGVTMTLLIVDMDPAPLQFSYYINPRGTVDSIAQPVTVFAGQSQDTFAIAMLTTSQLAIAANPNRLGTKIVNNTNTSNVFVGRTAGVTTATGDLIPPGGVIFVPGTQELYVIASSAGGDVRVTEIVR